MFFKKFIAKKLVRELKYIHNLLNSSSIIASLFQRACTIRNVIEYRYLSKQDQKDFDEQFAKIERKYLDYTFQPICRKEFCNLFMGDLKEGVANIEVIKHIQSVLPQIAAVFMQIKHDPIYINKRYELNYLDHSIDLSEAMQDVINNDYYYALTRLDDFLLRYKDLEDILDTTELYIIYFFLNGILLTADVSFCKTNDKLAAAAI